MLLTPAALIIFTFFKMWRVQMPQNSVRWRTKHGSTKSIEKLLLIVRSWENRTTVYYSNSKRYTKFFYRYKIFGVPKDVLSAPHTNSRGQKISGYQLIVILADSTALKLDNCQRYFIYSSKDIENLWFIIWCRGHITLAKQFHCGIRFINKST